VFDKGYNDYNWWNKICEIKSHFVTRPNTKDKISVLGALPLTSLDDEAGIVSDEMINIGNKSHSRSSNNYNHSNKGVLQTKILR
jgi:hypothetical protein